MSPQLRVRPIPASRSAIRTISDLRFRQTDRTVRRLGPEDPTTDQTDAVRATDASG
jgi:hypothetical protein